jgi:hypothetical protein
MKLLFALLLSSLLFACNAYRTSPESEVLFTRQDLTKRGFVISPLIDLTPRNTTSIADANAFDTILANTLKEQWKTVKLLTVAETTQMLDGEQVETWREALKTEKADEGSAATLTVLKKLTRQGKTYPSQALLPSVLQNSVSCGHKQALSTYLSPNPQGPKAYCQRVMKMRFRIMDSENSEILWNGIVYATQEATLPQSSKEGEDDPVIDPPTTQALIRECFHNFAKQFADK